MYIQYVHTHEHVHKYVHVRIYTYMHIVISLQVMYGGRAIDDFDRRVLKTYMDEYMGDFIFDTFQPFHFYHNQEVDYYIPPDGGLLEGGREGGREGGGGKLTSLASSSN